jgi:hypothetical protein
MSSLWAVEKTNHQDSKMSDPTSDLNEMYQNQSIHSQLPAGIE